MEESRNQQAAAVLDVAKNGRRENDEGLKATVAGATQSRSADHLAVVLNARFVRPIPHDALAQAAVEENFVGGRKDALERVVIQWVFGIGPGVNDAPQNAFML